MSDQRGADDPAIGPVQARALRRSALDEEVEVEPAAVPSAAPGDRPASVAGRDTPATAALDPVLGVEASRDAATAADQAARMTNLNARSGDLLARLRAGDANDPLTAAATADTDGDPDADAAAAGAPRPSRKERRSARRQQQAP